jgi:hypothetical protein
MALSNGPFETILYEIIRKAAVVHQRPRIAPQVRNFPCDQPLDVVPVALFHVESAARPMSSLL